MTQRDNWENKHLKDVARYVRQIEAIYRSAVRDIASIGAAMPDFNPDKPFSFADYPNTRARMEKLLKSLKNDIQLVVLNGIEAEWTLANNKNNELCNVVFGKYAKKLTAQQERRYYSNNDKARKAFAERKVAGLDLSDRVWRYTDQFKSEMEMGLDLGLRDGLSADEMSRTLRQYLQQPDRLFRRVKDEHGLLHLSKQAKAYHPGQGVYRSSYKNARRLAATETNIAYRTSDYTRWQQLDFVVGIEVKLSNNHTLNGVPFTDICDDLAGKYPKDFKFTGWHPHCRCYAVSILKTPEEMEADNKRIMAGEPLDGESVNKVTSVPAKFDQWIADNKERAKRSFSVPYFLKDNSKYLPKDYLNLYSMKTPYKTFAEYEAAMRYNRENAGFSAQQMANNRDLSKSLPVMQGKIMNFTEADGGKANPNYTLADAENKGFHHNCQTCTMAYELRRRGFRVEAAANPLLDGYGNYRNFDEFCHRNKIEWRDRFLKADGLRAEYEMSTGIKDTRFAKLKFIEEKTAEKGRYEVYCAWKTGGAHVFIVERQKGGNLLWFDPQSGRRGGALDFDDDYIAQMKSGIIGIMRIDDKLINPKFAARLLKATN